MCAPTRAHALDALARIVQDVADADASTAPRRRHGALDLAPARVADRAHAALSRRGRRRRTWCSGIGPRWAERTHAAARRRRVVRRSDRTLGAHRSRDAARRCRCRPSSTRSGARRRTAARCRPGSGIRARRADAARRRGRCGRPIIDVVGHVNNAAYWAAGRRRTRAPGPAARRARGDRVPGRTRPRATRSELATSRDTDDGFACLARASTATCRASMLVGCRP